MRRALLLLTPLFALLVAVTAACSATPAPAPPAAGSAAAPLRVVATTTIVGDAVRRIGGDWINLTVLLPAGSDPHAYVPTPQEMAALADAQVIFTNGLGLEQSLLPTLDKVAQGEVVAVNTNVQPLQAGDTADPHTWQDVRNVQQWAATIAQTLAALDPAHAAAYQDAAAAYRTELEALHAEVAATLSAIPAARRLLVTDHDDLAYLARAYGLQVVGAVVPSFSSLATISAQEMAALQDQIRAQNVPAIFVGSTVDPRLADQIAQDTGARVVSLYTDSLSAPDGPAATYVALMRHNAQAIADALK